MEITAIFKIELEIWQINRSNREKVEPFKREVEQGRTRMVHGTIAENIAPVIGANIHELDFFKSDAAIEEVQPVRWRVSSRAIRNGRCARRCAPHNSREWRRMRRVQIAGTRSQRYQPPSTPIGDGRAP